MHRIASVLTSVVTLAACASSSPPPSTTIQANNQIYSLQQENAALRTDLAAVKSRLKYVEDVIAWGKLYDACVKTQASSGKKYVSAGSDCQ